MTNPLLSFGPVNLGREKNHAPISEGDLSNADIRRIVIPASQRTAVVQGAFPFLTEAYAHQGLNPQEDLAKARAHVSQMTAVETLQPAPEHAPYRRSQPDIRRTGRMAVSLAARQANMPQPVVPASRNEDFIFEGLDHARYQGIGTNPVTVAIDSKLYGRPQQPNTPPLVESDWLDAISGNDDSREDYGLAR